MKRDHIWRHLTDYMNLNSHSGFNILRLVPRVWYTNSLPHYHRNITNATDRLSDLSRLATHLPKTFYKTLGLSLELKFVTAHLPPRLHLAVGFGGWPCQLLSGAILVLICGRAYTRPGHLLLFPSGPVWPREGWHVLCHGLLAVIRAYSYTFTPSTP
jgi:hypothetical protein